MEVKTIVKEIQRLPLSKRFFVMEQTLKSIKKEELNHQTEKAVELFIQETDFGKANPVIEEFRMSI